MNFISKLFIIIFLFWSNSAYALVCSGFMVNGYGSTHPLYKRFKPLNFSFETCGFLTPNFLCETVYINGEKKNAYYAEGKFMFFNPSGIYTLKTGHILFKMGDVGFSSNANDDERWFEGICK